MPEVQGLQDRCAEALTQGFDTWDRSSEERGFWDADQQTYVRALVGVKGDRGVEPPDDRYVPFGLAGALEAQPLVDERCDTDHMFRASRWVAKLWREGGFSEENFFYGGLWALAVAARRFRNEEFATVAMEALERWREPFLASSDLNYGVALLGLSRLSVDRPAPWLTDTIVAKADVLAQAVNDRCIPATGDPRAAYHQRMMYTSWGLSGAGAALQREDWLQAARKMITFAIEERMDPDGGLRWHAMREKQVLPDGSGRFYPYGRHLYYECHQCFFIIATELYRQATGSEEFREVRDLAASWIFGANRWAVDLTRNGPTGLPVRCLTSGGTIGPARNRFKGAYEVGAYLWALSLITSDERSRA